MSEPQLSAPGAYPIINKLQFIFGFFYDKN